MTFSWVSNLSPSDEFAKRVRLENVSIGLRAKKTITWYLGMVKVGSHFLKNNGLLDLLLSFTRHILLHTIDVIVTTQRVVIY